MKIVSFTANNEEHGGILHNGRYYKLNSVFDGINSVLDFISVFGGGEISAAETLFLKKAETAPFFQESEIKLLAPIPYPPRAVICLGKNYADHAKEVKETIQSNQDENLIPTAPIYFAKTAYPAYAHNQSVPIHPEVTQKADYEVELGVIIGKEGKNIAPQNAEQYIFGYTIIDDLTARDLQTKHSQWFFGKSLDGFTPIGPCIVTRDKIPFPPKLNIECRVNGELRQKSTTDMMIFDIPHVISELSKGMTLRAGDIIATGTPAGIGHALKPPQYLKAGDIVECEIEGIGILTSFFA